MACTITYKGQKFSEEDFRAFVKNNLKQFSKVPRNTDRNIFSLLDEGKPIPGQEEVEDKIEERRAVLNTINSALDRLSSRTGIVFEYDPTISQKGYYDVKQDKVFINPDKVTLDTPFHEFAHPFILALRKSNKPLYNALIEEASSDVNTMEAIKLKYPEYTQEDVQMEALVTLIGNEAKTAHESGRKKSLIARFIKWIKEFLESFEGVSAKDFKLTTTISDLGAFFANSNTKINIDRDSFINDESLLDIYEERLVDEDTIKNLTDKFDEMLKSANLTDEQQSKFENDMQEYQKKLLVDIQKRMQIVVSKIRESTKSGKVSSESLRNRKQELSDLVDDLNVIGKVSGIVRTIAEFSSQMDKTYSTFVNNVMPRFSDIKSKSVEEQEELQAIAVQYYDLNDNYNIFRELLEDPILKQLLAGSFKDNPQENPLLMLDKALRKSNLIKDNAYSFMVKTAYATIIKPTLRNVNTDAVEKEIKPRIEQLKIELNNQKSKLENESEQKKINRLKERISRIESKISYFESMLGTINVDQGTFEKLFKIGEQDIGMIDYATLPAISSPDAVIAGFAKFIKEKISLMRDDLRSFEAEIGLEYEQFKKANGSKFSSIDEFDDFLETVDIPVFGLGEDGKRVVVRNKRVRKFIEEIDLSRYYSERNKAKEKTGNNFRAYAQWILDNSIFASKEEVENRIAVKKAELANGLITEDEYEKWYNNNVLPNKGFKSKYNITGEFVKANPQKYQNNKYKQLLLPQNTHKKKLYDYITKKYFEFQELLPPAHRRGFVLPSIDKGFNGRVRENGPLKAISDAFLDFGKYLARDQEYGSSELSGDSYKTLPIYFTQEMNGDQVSSDIILSIMMFGKMAQEYSAKADIMPQINTMVSIIENRRYKKTNESGASVKDWFASKIGIEQDLMKDKTDGYNYNKLFIAFIDNVIFGQHKAKESVNIFGREIAIDKIIDKMIGLQSLSSLGGIRLLKEGANNLQANMMNLMFSNKFSLVTKKDFFAGARTYATNSNNIIGDILNRKIHGKSLHTQLIEMFDAIQGDYLDMFGKGITGNITKRFINGDFTMFMQHLSEHEAQISLFFGYLHATKVNQNGKQIKLIDAYELDNNGVIKLKDGVEFSRTDQLDLENKIHASAKRLYGIYNSFDRGALQKYSIFRAILTFRKYLVPGFKMRFKKFGYDYELDSTTEGFYNSFFSYLKNGFKQMNTDYWVNMSTLTPLQKENVLRAWNEVAMITLFSVIGSLLTAVIEPPEDDDSIGAGLYDSDFEERSELYKRSLYAAQYLAIRLLSELNQYVPGYGTGDLLRIFSKPAVISSQTERIFRFFNSILPSNIDDRYERNQGMWEKGDLKAIARLLAIFGITGNEWNPKYAVKNFKLFQGSN